MHLTEVALGDTVQMVDFDLDMSKHNLEKQGVRVLMPLPLLRTAFLTLSLQGQLSLRRELNEGMLICTARGWNIALMGATGQSFPHLKVLYQPCIQLKASPVFRDGQQIKVLRVLPCILHAVPRPSLNQHCGTLACTSTPKSRVILTPSTSNVTHKRFGGVPMQHAIELGRRSPLSLR